MHNLWYNPINLIIAFGKEPKRSLLPVKLSIFHFHTFIVPQLTVGIAYHRQFPQILGQFLPLVDTWD